VRKEGAEKGEGDEDGGPIKKMLIEVALPPLFGFLASTDLGDLGLPLPRREEDSSSWISR
jgi:hypothetical protein